MDAKEIFEEIRKDVVGQDEVLRFVSVAIFKHISGEKFGNLLMIGNSGTGKTSIMLAMEKLYSSLEELQKYQVVARLNANVLADSEDGLVRPTRLIKTVEERAIGILGKEVTAEKLKEYIEHATVCVDEVDKVSGKVGGKANVLGINIQQSLLTLMEGERIVYDTFVYKDGVPSPERILINTGNMLFICGGAFEELYDQVYTRVFKEKKAEGLTQIYIRADGQMAVKQRFNLRQYIEHSDLFIFGILPQFLSRFDNAIVLNDLSRQNLVDIFTQPENSVFNISKRFFKKMDIDLELTTEALNLIALEAEKFPRLGARALKSVYSKIIKPFEFDPTNQPQYKKNGDRNVIAIDKETVVKAFTQ